MEINPVIKMLSTHARQNLPTPVYKGLATDTFQRSTSFRGECENIYSRSFRAKLTPKLSEKLNTIDPNTGISVLETLANKGDDLRGMLENLAYLNGRQGSGRLDDLSAKEVAYLFVSCNSQQTMGELTKNLSIKKQEMPKEKYEQMLTNVINGNTEA